MTQQGSQWKAKGRSAAPLAFAATALALCVPSAGLAVVSLTDGSSDSAISDLNIFTPASVDPSLAARAADTARENGIRFTPAGAPSERRDRTVTVAVRVDSDTAQAISVRSAAQLGQTASDRLSSLQPTRYNLGTALGYESFARPAQLPDSVRNISMPDLSTYEPARSTAPDEPSRLQPRIALEGEEIAGRSRNTLDALSAQTVDLGGSYSVTRNLDVTAGVRISQERDRLAPLTDSAQDSQAVYVGTQFRF